MVKTRKTEVVNKKTNGFAIAGFILSFFGITAILGFIFSIIGLNQIKRTGEKGKGLATAGVIISSILLLILMILIVIGISKNNVGSQLTEQEFKEKAITPSYTDMMYKSEQLKGSIVFVHGGSVNIQRRGDNYQWIRFGITNKTTTMSMYGVQIPVGSYWEDTVLVNWQGNPILENVDEIDVWGTYQGIQTYEQGILKVKIDYPVIKAKYIEYTYKV